MTDAARNLRAAEPGWWQPARAPDVSAKRTVEDERGGALPRRAEDEREGASPRRAEDERGGAPPRRAKDTVAFRALIAFLFLLLLAPQNFVPALASVRPALLAGGLAVGTCLVGRFVRGERLSRASRPQRFAAALGGWAILTIPLSYWPGGSFSVLLDLYLKALALFWLLANLVDTPDRLRRVIVVLTIMGLPLAVTGMRNYASGTFLEEGGAEVPRIAGYHSGLAGNPNDLALVLNLLVPLAIGLALSGRRVREADRLERVRRGFAPTSARRVREADRLERARRGFAPTSESRVREADDHQDARRGGTAMFVAAATLAAGVIVTFSRAGFIALMTTVGLFAFKRARRGHLAPVAGVLILGLLALPLLPDGYISRVASITDVKSDPTGSAQTRWADTLAALRVVAAQPVFGTGLGTNILALNEERGASWTAVHNVYLEHGVELGLPGLALFVGLLVSCWRSVRRARHAAELAGHQELFHLTDGIEVAVIAFAVSGLFYPVAYHFYFYLVAGLAAAAGAQRVAVEEHT